MGKQGLLLSGGMDSLAVAYWLRPEVAFTINYGQRSAEAEISASKSICNALGIKHQIVEIDCSGLGSGDLSPNKAIDLAPKSDWWPYRNQMLVTICGMAGLSIGISEILVGSVRCDSYHKDGSVEFYESLHQLMLLQEGKVSVRAPAIEMTTKELIIKSEVPSEILMWAHSCHKSNTPCNSCRGCNKYFSVLNELDKHSG